MFQYQKDPTYFAQIADGFEALAVQELETWGARRVRPAYRGIHFRADAPTLYRINYHAKMVSRILAPLIAFRCRDRKALYNTAKTIEWGQLFCVDQTFGIFSNVSGNDQLRHSKFAALCLKDAIVDQFRDRLGKRPNVDKKYPDVWIHLLINKERAAISFDTSGGSLHKRGYRKSSGAAPMKETLAAAMIALSGWQADRPLVDPMCGAGTLLCEAIIAAARIPAGHLRKGFGFQHLPDFDAKAWQSVKAQSDAKIRPLTPKLIYGSDWDNQAAKSARINCNQLPGGSGVTIDCKSFEAIDAIENSIIVCNPPYGIRMGDANQLAPFYKKLGDFLKQRCKGSTAYLYFGNREMIKKIGLKPTWKKPMRNAGLDGRVVKYEMY